MKTILIAVATFIASIGLGMAQTAKELLTTVGTTVQVSGNYHAYVLWQPGDSGSTLGKRFAIYSKAGTADTAGNYTRHGIQTLQTSPKTIRALLELGEALDPAAAGCYVRIDGIYRDLTLQSNAAASTPADVSLDAADKLAYIIKSAATDQRLLARLFFLGRAHPGVMQALGHGFSLRITSGVRTFEIREINLSDNDVRVVLCVKLREGLALTEALSQQIRNIIRSNTTPRHVPARIVQVDDIPRTISGKIVELAVRNMVHGQPVKNTDALANPEALAYFRDRDELKS